jgi:(E)-4-hydroxy-3-methylbut-2-enyl-diphosphate synthase
MIPYCEAIFKTKRRKTREVLVGNVGVGGNNPVRIQSMTTSSTRDIDATIEQAIRLADAGCEIVRVTVQGIKEADACEGIKNGLVQKGYNIPLVADIHFFPPAAMRVADFVDKVRINPGNFVDKRASFKVIEYDDASYARELEKIVEKFTPLVEKCKRLKRAIRIGTNHGSLSDRIMNRYGDTPQGMVESALEFARICRNNDYHDLIFSMKSSNPQVMILAYRLLAAEMQKLGWDYPLHLGVTEAGEGEDGRIKSAMGIGSLLLDGIGDTIRVSLTENAWNEIDPCKRLVAFAESYQKASGVAPFTDTHRDFTAIERRAIVYPKHISLHKSGSVILEPKEINYSELGCSVKLGQIKLQADTVDCLIMKDGPQKLKEIGISTLSPLTLNEAKQSLFSLIESVVIQDEEHWDALETITPQVIFLSPTKNRLHYCRKFFDWLKLKNIQTPVILNFAYNCSQEDLVIQSAAELGALLCDGLGEGIWIKGPYPVDFLRNLSFSILQAARMRTSKTDFISCPSCGRTLFDLQDVSKRIRTRTGHLPGVKIAIMGCIVNGPGEMADADFGYVGSKPGMIDLYVGKTCVEKDISFDDADDRLVELIKKYDRWQEPEQEEVACLHSS